MKPIRAYHFFGDTLRDGTPVPHDGVSLEANACELELCRYGLHASTHPYDALLYAPGPNLAIVELSGAIIRGDDKLCASQRTIIQRIDATDLLRRFARECALDVIHLWDAPEIVVRYLETGDESIRNAARDAAWGAAGATEDAAWAAADAARAAWAAGAVPDAAWAARDAAWGAWAARDAAWGAARDAARAAWAARNAARAAADAARDARDAARDARDARDAARDARDAARDARDARDAVRATQRERFQALVDEAFAAGARNEIVF